VAGGGGNDSTAVGEGEGLGVATADGADVVGLGDGVDTVETVEVGGGLV
jgi:hypothetical protein